MNHNAKCRIEYRNENKEFFILVTGCEHLDHAIVVAYETLEQSLKDNISEFSNKTLPEMIKMIRKLYGLETRSIDIIESNQNQKEKTICQ